MAAQPLAEPSHVREVVEYDLLLDCVHCGLCLEVCPTYVTTRAEMDSPRGRIHLMKSLAQGMALDADAVRHFDLCLGCRGCETACPSGVHYGRLIEQARDYVERNYRRGIADRFRRAVVSAMFPYPSRLRALLAPLRLIERAGLRPALARVLPVALGEWLALAPPLASRAAPPAPRSDGGDGPVVAVHPGCVTQVLAQSENVNSERILAAAGYRIAKLPAISCCGALDLHMGNRERAMRFARANVRALRRSGADKIVSAASGCSAAIAEYGELLKNDRELAADAAVISGQVADLASLILARTPIDGELPCTVTYHDACHLAHGLGVRDAPRRLLQAIRGVRLIEMAESDLCCGSAGTYNLTEPKMSRSLVQRKADNIIATGADYVVLANPGCEFQIGAELRRRGAKTRAVHLANFLEMAGQSGAT